MEVCSHSGTIYIIMVSLLCKERHRNLFLCLISTPTRTINLRFFTLLLHAPPALTKLLLDLLVPNNADSQDLFTARDADGNTPLHLTCANSMPITARSGTVDIVVVKRLADAAPQVFGKEATYRTL
jgi:hypothetical protein